MRQLRRIVLVSALLLSACGFSPIYGTHSDGRPPVAATLQRVAIENIPDHEGQMLRNHLIDRMYANGRPSDPVAHLYVSLQTSEADLGIQKDATATRRQLTLLATYALKDNTDKLLFSGRAHSVVSYSRLEAQYGNVTAQRNAQERAINEVGEQIVNRLSLYYAEGAPVAKP